jgi:hypothetical protein
VCGTTDRNFKFAALDPAVREEVATFGGELRIAVLILCINPARN